ncbi:MAG: IS3 family transposase, partial [Casimicrobium sp.]
MSEEKRKSRPPYPVEFRQQLVELVASGRTAAELSREFGASAQSIGEWVKKAGTVASLPRGAVILAAHRQAVAVANKTALTVDERSELERLRKENKRLQIERDILGKGYGLVCRHEHAHVQRVYQVIRANQAAAVNCDGEHKQRERSKRFAIKTMCRVLGVSRSGYHDWYVRKPAARTVENAALAVRIKAIHAVSDRIYGAPKICAELRDADVADHDPRWASVGENRVARLMRINGLRGVSRRRSFIVTTERNKKDRPAPDLVKREFVADAPNMLWVADITYVSTWAGFVYLAVVIDVWSRRVVGWQIGEQMTADLVVNALNMALTQRKPDSVIHHSDQGSQYTSLAFGKRCEQFGVRPSMGTVGDAYDNAMAESFFAS